MFIQTEATDDPNIMKFLPGREVYPAGPLGFESEQSANASPLATRLFGVDDVAAVEFGADYVAVTKAASAEWLHMTPAVLGAIMDHFVAGLPVVRAPSASTEAPGLDNEAAAEFLKLDESDPIIAEIKELIETRIKPAAVQGGGDISLRGYKEGMVYLEFEGSAFKLMGGIENMLRHYVPEVAGVADWRDALPKPGLDTPDGRAIQELLDRQINPSVAGHGGHIALIDIEGARAYIRMEGGCQGCGMANVTLKEGIEGEIQKIVPTIREVLDVTDHAGGTNPYYQA
jgi:Fe-S cluster biogenesis protein NfuA